jgi:DNA-binding MarR family transcriptional regulator
MTTDPPVSDRVRRSVAALELAALHHRREVRRRLRVGDEELSALLHLAHHGGVMQQQLAAATSLSRSGAGAMLQRLEERGYVQRRTDTSDRRLRLVELSPAGREAIDRAYGAFARALDRALREEAEADVTVLARLLDEVGSAIAPAEPRTDGAGTSPEAPGEPIWRHWS